MTPTNKVTLWPDGSIAVPNGIKWRDMKTMKVQCKIKKLSSIRDTTVLKHVQQYVHLEEVGLTVGRTYPVFGIAFRQGIPWYLICEELDADYPKTHCSAFFDLVDAKIPEGWAFSLHSRNLAGPGLLPDKWVVDGSFLEKLVDDDPSSINVFEELKKQYFSRS